jgi:hypothetical protein
MVAKIEPTERQSAGATAGSGDILHKFEERLRALKDDLQYTSERQTPAEGLHGSDNKSNKQLEELKGRLDDLLRPSHQSKPVLHSSDGKSDEPLRTTLKSLQPISLPSKPVVDLHGSGDNEQLEDLLSPSPQRKPEEEDESAERDDLRLRIISYPDHEASERRANYDLPIENKMARRSSRGFARYLVAVLIGVAATLSWQSYGDVAKQIIAARAPELGSSPEAKQMIAGWMQQLGWTKPPVVESKAAPVAQTAPATPSIDAEQLHQMARDLATLRQTVGQLAAGLDQVTREIGKLEAADVEILEKITPATPPPRPIAAPAGKPTPIARPSSRAPATRPTSLVPPPPDQSNSPEPGTEADSE